MREIKYYEVNQQLSPVKIISTLDILILFSYVFSFIYGTVLAIIPSFYIVPLVCVIYIWVIVKLYLYWLDISVIENKKWIRIFSFILIFLSLYFSWGAFFNFIYTPEALISSFFSKNSLAFKPLYLLELFGRLFRSEPFIVKDYIFQKSYLILILFIESFFMYKLLSLMFYKKQLVPFSVVNNRWYDAYNLTMDTEPYFEREFQNITTTFENNPIAATQLLDRGTADEHTKLTCYYVSGENKHYLSMYMHYFSKGKMKKEVIFSLLEISSQEQQALFKNHSFRK